ncbi:MAG: hypothetical protein WBL28_11630 [Methylotenera sp.]
MNLPNYRLKNGLIEWLQLVVIAAFIPCANAAPPTPSFSMLGYLQELNVDNLNDPLSAGSMVVNGVRVILPSNLLIKMPGQYLTVNDLFRGPHPGTAPTLVAAVRPSGLAIKDVPKPVVPYEVQVIGNMLGNDYVAGWVNITQQDLNSGAGFIRSIDYAKGELLVGAETGPTTARVRINDPAGRYGKKNSVKTGGSAFDERIASDPGNAPVVSATGFPMCIPRVAPPANDVDCPLVNRAPAPNNGRFTCGISTVDPTAPPHPACNPSKAAPLQVGDYITFAGMLTEDSPGSGTFFHSAHAVGAMTGIYTSPGVDPAYVFIEEAILGALGVPYSDIPQEATSRFHIVGFTTDPSRRVEVFLIDVNGTTETERRLTTLPPQTAGQIGRFRITLPAKANFLPVTRDVRVRIEGHTSVKVAGGLDSGQYTAPVGEYIYPENTLFGKPLSPVSVPFENFCFLRNGGGLLGTLGRDTLPDASRPLIGKLLPFPDSGHPDPQPRTNGTPACP